MIKKTRTTPRWILWSVGIVLALAVVLTIIYVIQCQTMDGEFAGVKDFFGEEYDQIFEGNRVDKEVCRALTEQAEAALTFVGTKEEAEAFGPFARYCTDTGLYPGADRAECTLDIVAGRTQGPRGWLWIAYTQKVCDRAGAPVTGSGSEDHRILSRWTLEETGGAWHVAEIKEAP